MNNPLDTLKNKKLKVSTRPVRRLMGFREWCEKVYEPSKRIKQAARQSPSINRSSA